MLRPLDSGTGVEYTVILKRGAWGPEHAMVSPEDRDTIDKHRLTMCNTMSRCLCRTSEMLGFCKFDLIALLMG